MVYLTTEKVSTWFFFSNETDVRSILNFIVLRGKAYIFILKEVDKLKPKISDIMW